jgi:hypothetical protein
MFKIVFAQIDQRLSNDGSVCHTLGIVKVKKQDFEISYNNPKKSQKCYPAL